MSIVEPQYCRNMPFDRFAFAVENLPEVEQQSPACVGLGLPVECEVPVEKGQKPNDCVVALQELGGCAERKLLTNKICDKFGVTTNYARVKITRATEQGLIYADDNDNIYLSS